ncbi:hypothetical protein ACIQU5_28115 [Streptomyces sp. NPDC090306]|uniref:hypothetical protein n=1 Tax=Streptomyces sp. NPDC090306 TaxID=3365961 RepID=UPI003820F596
MSDLTPEENRAVREAVAEHLRALGKQVRLGEDWDAANALDVLRENRARRAADPRVQGMREMGEGLVSDLLARTDATPPQILSVLLFTSSWVGGAAVLNGYNGTDLANLLGHAAATAADQVQAGDPS